MDVLIQARMMEVKVGLWGHCSSTGTKEKQKCKSLQNIVNTLNIADF